MVFKFDVELNWFTLAGLLVGFILVRLMTIMGVIVFFLDYLLHFLRLRGSFFKSIVDFFLTCHIEGFEGRSRSGIDTLRS